mmetsp:Transcript_47224/g.111359  ORF Transcript_47224/g.111359 Transcript_47224/m.111359 type:complete len:599 (-) Transcript_47224:1108-2904(-)
MLGRLGRDHIVRCALLWCTIVTVHSWCLRRSCKNASKFDAVVGTHTYPTLDSLGEGVFRGINITSEIHALGSRLLLESRPLVHPSQQALYNVGIPVSEYEDLLRFQAFIFLRQFPADCHTKRWVEDRGASVGLGAQLQVQLARFSLALSNGALVFSSQKVKYANSRLCPKETWECYFMPICGCQRQALSQKLRIKQHSTVLPGADVLYFSSMAGLSRLYPQSWYSREMLRFLTRPNKRLLEKMESFRQELSLEMGFRFSVAAHMRFATEKHREIREAKQKICQPFYNPQTKIGNFVARTEHVCSSFRSNTCVVFVAGDLVSHVTQFRDGLKYRSVVINKTHFRENPDRSSNHWAGSLSRNADDGLALLAQTRIQAESHVYLGSVSSSLHRYVCTQKQVLQFTLEGMGCLDWDESVFSGYAGMFGTNGINPAAIDCAATALNNVKHLSTPELVDSNAGFVHHLPQCERPIFQDMVTHCSLDLCVDKLFCPKAQVVFWPTIQTEVLTRALQSSVQSAFGPCTTISCKYPLCPPDNWFIFTFIRNPTLRAVSAFLDFATPQRCHLLFPSSCRITLVEGKTPCTKNGILRDVRCLHTQLSCA